MPNILFENIAAQIAAGTITAEQILQNACSALSALEKQALLIALAQTSITGATLLEPASVFSGLMESGDSPLTIPAFLTGGVIFVDTDASATVDLTGTHQYATDNLGDSFPEGSRMDWPFVPGKYYVTRELTVPAGMIALYTFILS